MANSGADNPKINADNPNDSEDTLRGSSSTNSNPGSASPMDPPVKPENERASGSNRSSEISTEVKKEEERPLLTNSKPDPESSKASSIWGWNGWTTAMSVVSAIKEAASEISTELANSAPEAEEHSSHPPLGEKSVRSVTGEPLNVNQTQEESNSTSNAANDSSILDQGLKALDESVDTMALGALQAIGTFWKGSIDLVHNIEHSAGNLAHSIQEGNAHTLTPVIFEGGKDLALKGMRALEFVGKETIDLFIDGKDLIDVEGMNTEKEKESEHDKDRKKVSSAEFKIQYSNGSNNEVLVGDDVKNTLDHFDVKGETEINKQNGDDDDNENEGDEDVNFSHCFYIYGGPEYIEELEEISNHHQLLITRAKKKFSEDEKKDLEEFWAQLEKCMTLLPDETLSDMSLLKNVRGKKFLLLPQEGLLSDEKAKEIISFRDSSISEAFNLASGFSLRVNDSSVWDMKNKTKERIDAIRTEGIHRLSELCAMCISHLLQLRTLILSKDSFSGKDPLQVETVDHDKKEGPLNPVETTVEEGKESGEEREVGNGEDGTPPSNQIQSPFQKGLCLEKSGYVLDEAQSMASHLQKVSSSFITSLKEVFSSYQMSIEEDITNKEKKIQIEPSQEPPSMDPRLQLEKITERYCRGLEMDEKIAEQKINEALILIVHVVVSSCIIKS